MSERRFTEKPELNPAAVMSLHESHAAMRENRTLFPTTVVTVTADEPDRLLVSGKNNRKIGATVEKGKFKGYSIFCLSLEERATCPADCELRGACYGNGMQMARRHRIGDGDVFYDRLGFEIAELLDDHEGLLIRLHVLGDFPSVEYVSFWKDVLDEHPKVACFGYTHRSPTNWGGDEIGDAIQAVKDAHPERFRIRWSSPVARADGAVVINNIPRGPRAGNLELVCPSQTDATACCATCALCWEDAAKRECIAFIKHGRMSDDVEAAAVRQEMVSLPAMQRETPDAPPQPAGDLRRVQPIKLPTVKPGLVPASDMPEVRQVKPTDLIVEASYQRDLSGKSISLIKRIVAGWDWAKYKPPVCAEGDGGLFVIDGQHTAIAAASHPQVVTIPVMVVQRERIAYRADAFVSQNTERVVMSPLQVFHAQVVAGDKAATEIIKAVVRAGGSVPRSVPQRGKTVAGQIVAITALHRIYRVDGIQTLDRILKIAVMSKLHPINSTLLYGLQYVVRHPDFELARNQSDSEIAFALSGYTEGSLERDAQALAVDSDVNRYRAAALLIQAAFMEGRTNAAA